MRSKSHTYILKYAEEPTEAGILNWRLKMKYKKSCHHIRKRTIAEYVSFIQNNPQKYTVKQMCKALKFARSIIRLWSMYLQIRSRNMRKLPQRLSNALKKAKKRYGGAIKLHRKLNEKGIPCSIKRV